MRRHRYSYLRFIGQNVPPGVPSVPYSPLELDSRDPRDPRQATPPLWPFPEWDTPPDVRLRPRLSPVGQNVQAGEGAPPLGIETTGAPVQLPPWLFPPFGAFVFDLPANRLPVVVAAAGSLIVSLPRLPLGTNGVVSRIGVSTTDAANTRLTTRVNANPVPPWGGIIGAVSALENPTDLPAPIVLRAGDEFSVLLENIGAAAINMIARLMGWWYAGGV